MDRDQIVAQIEDLKIEIEAMKLDPLLKDQYGKKVKELSRLRRSLVRRGKVKNRE